MRCCFTRIWNSPDEHRFTQLAYFLIAGRNEESLKALKNEGGCFGYVVGDLTADGECERIVKEAVSQLGGLTTLVNVAGVLKGGAMGSVDLNNFEFNFKV